MTMIDVLADDGVMDFSNPAQNIKFRLDGDEFEALPEIAAVSMLRFADEATRLDRDDVGTDEKIKIIQGLFRMVLTTESATRFIRRLEDDAHPIGMARFGEIVEWLMERYGLRPTEPDSAS